jgi:hypothetical protein
MIQAPMPVIAPFLLGQLDEVLRTEQPADRVLPADQGLDPGQGTPGQVDDRLVLHHELLGVDRLVQRGPHLQPFLHRHVQVAAVRLPGRLARALGQVERHVGVAQQLGGAAGVPADRDADA